MAEGAMRAGAIGVTFGRNVFQHPAPGKIVQALARVVLRGASAREALRIVGQ
jgi:DhnA family fructose-bisphosphate aldolase class Ia